MVLGGFRFKVAGLGVFSGLGRVRGQGLGFSGYCGSSASGLGFRSGRCRGPGFRFRGSRVKLVEVLGKGCGILE